MLKPSIVVAVLFSIAASAAAHLVHGTVKDIGELAANPTKCGIEAVTVSVMSNGKKLKQALTDQTGSYSFDIAAGAVQLNYSRLNYENNPTVIDIQITGDQNVDDVFLMKADGTNGVNIADGIVALAKASPSPASEMEKRWNWIRSSALTASLKKQVAAGLVASKSPETAKLTALNSYLKTDADDLKLAESQFKAAAKDPDTASVPSHADLSEMHVPAELVPDLASGSLRQTPQSKGHLQFINTVGKEWGEDVGKSLANVQNEQQNASKG